MKLQGFPENNLLHHYESNPNILIVQSPSPHHIRDKPLCPPLCLLSSLSSHFNKTTSTSTLPPTQLHHIHKFAMHSLLHLLIIWLWWEEYRSRERSVIKKQTYEVDLVGDVKKKEHEHKFHFPLFHKGLKFISRQMHIPVSTHHYIKIIVSVLQSG